MRRFLRHFLTGVDDWQRCRTIRRYQTSRDALAQPRRTRTLW